jgi:transposase InsO family protein
MVLKTADQYDVWKSRVADACYSATNVNVFTVSDDECKAAIQVLEEKVEKAEKARNWVGKCWSIITTSLHDDVYRKVTHVPRGLLHSLLTEVAHALVVNNMEEVQPLRLELYGASMQKDCGNDLQSWINYIVERQGKLLFLKKAVAEDELVSIFLKGLQATVFQQLQVYFAIPGQLPNSFEKAVSVTRKFAANPHVATELVKLKSSGMSQTMFPLVPQVPQVPKQKQAALCRLFASTGTCRFGTRCKFVHTATPANGQSTTPTQSQPHRKCDFCQKPGHTEDVCHFRQRLLSQMRTQTTAVAVVPATSLNQESKTADSSTASAEQYYDNHFSFVFTLSTAANRKSWVLDSGATCCATPFEDDCIDVRECKVKVTGAGTSFEVLRIGTAVINTLDETGRPVQLNMRNTLISPKFPCKLLALQLFTVKGYEVVMGKDRMRIMSHASNRVFVGFKDQDSQLFLLSESTASAQSSHTFLARSYGEGKSDADLLWKLHLRHGHRNFADVCRQYNLPLPKQMPACTSCIMGKSHVHPHLSSGFERATRPAEGFHSDFRGPFSVPTPQGFLYLLTIIDDCSRLIFGFLTKSQSEWSEIWSKFVVRVEAEIGRANCISWLLSDNGGVYKSATMTAFCASKGIQQRFSAPYAQWMDHTAERNMRTIGEMAVTTLVHANLPKTAWGHAVMHAIDVINRTADPSTNKTAGFPANFSRLEKWKGKELPGHTKGLYPFGCLAFKHVPTVLRTKLDQHAMPAVYLGLDPRCRAFLLGTLYDLDVSTSVEATFVENVFPFRKIKHRESPSSLLWGTDNNMSEGDPRLGMFADNDSSGFTKVLDRHALKSIGALPPNVPEQESPVVFSPPAVTETKTVQEPVVVNVPGVRRSSRASKPPADLARFDQIPWKDYPTQWDSPTKDPVSILLALTETQLQTITPKTADQALQSLSHEQWLAAMNREKQCHVKNGTFGEEWNQEGSCPKPIPAGWVYKIKHRGEPIEEKDLSLLQFKARVVIRGQFMQEGLDFNDTFAAVAKPATIRAVFAIASKNGCKLKAGDIETAFLTADMDCEVWVKMPPYWGGNDEAITGDKRDSPPRRLLKGVPGIPQGSRLFHDTFAAHLATMGWKPSTADKCLFLNPSLSELTAVIIWVDDFLFMHEQESTWQSFLKALRERFTVPTVGDLNSFLGMSIVYNPTLRVMHVSQVNTVNNLLERAQMADCNAVSTPCVVGCVFTKTDCPEVPDPIQVTKYRALVALANFISCWTRPDITFTVNKLCKYMSNPGAVHWQALKHLLRYLKGTSQLGLYYDFGQQTEVQGLHGYSDASYADCPDTSKSTIGYVFYYGGAILSWFSKLHTFVTTCTNHSEYAALAAGAKEAQWMVYLFEELEPGVKHTPVPLFVDNTGIISLVFNPVESVFAATTLVNSRTFK